MLNPLTPGQPLTKQAHQHQINMSCVHLCDYLSVTVAFWQYFADLCVTFGLCRETLRDVVQMLRNTGNPQVEYIVRTIKKWAKENRVPIM